MRKWMILLAAVLMPAYARMSTESEAVIADVIVYGRIVCVCSIGLFLESGWTKVLQAEGTLVFFIGGILCFKYRKQVGPFFILVMLDNGLHNR